MRRSLHRPTLSSLGLTTPGSRVGPGFVVRSVRPVPEFNLQAVRLHHPATNAEWLHVDSEDTNNAFAVGFRTPPGDDTGLPHILEHVALCGSRAFPVRDPFFKMLKRSLNTFMNAMTAGDFTFYPFSTQNVQDYRNLTRVYTDAAFFPLLREADFKQEGHRLEIGPTGALVRSGVVYNEMKGALSDSSSLFSTRVAQALFGPDSPYGRVSGGDPQAIPDLTHENLVAFHGLHYHPSNALFVTYGDMNVIPTLEYVGDNVLAKFQASARSRDEVRARIVRDHHAPAGHRPHPSGRLRIPLPPDGERDDKSKFIKAWKLPMVSSTDQYWCLVGRILSSLLMGGPQAPLHAAVVDACVAPDFAPGSGFDSSSIVPTFALGVQGVREADVDGVVNDTVLHALERTAKEGFPQARVDAIRHQLELSIKHRRANFGLHVVQSAMGAWAHLAEPESALPIQATLARLRDEGRNPEMWKGLVRDWVLQGWTRPDVEAIGVVHDSFARDAAEREAARLAKEAITVDLEAVRRANEALKREREAKEDVEVLPTLSLDKDVPREAPQVITTKWWNSAVCSVAAPTNGVGYFRFWLPLAPVSKDNVTPPPLVFLLLPMLCNVLGQVDVRSPAMDYKELALQLETWGGSLGISPQLTPVWRSSPGSGSGAPRMTMELQPGCLVTFDALHENTDQALALLRAVVLESDLTSSTTITQRLPSLLATYAQGVIAALPHDAMSYAKVWALAPHHPMYALQERWSGFSRVALAQYLLGRCGDEAGRLALARALDQTRAAWLSGSSSTPRSSFVSTTDTQEVLKGVVMDTHAALTRSAPSAAKGEGSTAFLTPDNAPDFLTRPHGQRTFVKLPGVGVHYCVGTLATGVGFGHEDDAAMMLLMQILKHDFLHREVRESGGAYGSGASIGMDGIVVLTSYWDPNSVKTLQAFDRGLAWLCEDGSFEDRAVSEALLVVFGDIDAPISPGKQGYGEFLSGITNEERQRRRARLLDLVPSRGGVAKLQHVARKYLGPHSADRFSGAENSPNVTVVVAGKAETWEGEFEGRGGGWEVRQF